MRSKYKSLIAFLLVAVMVFTMLPTSVANAGAKKARKSSRLVTGAVVGTEGVVEMEPTEDQGTATTKSNGKFEAVTVPSGSEEELTADEPESVSGEDGSSYLSSLFAAPLLKDGPADTAPANSKKLYDNGDGTYTLALNVTGTQSSSSTTEVSKANVILVLDTSSSMNASAGNNFYLVHGTPRNPSQEGNTRTTYYRKVGNNYYQVYYNNGAWRETDSRNGTVFNGPFYATSRLWAEIHALIDDNGIIDNLLAQNVPGDPVKNDIIEVSVIGFDMSAYPVSDGFSTSGTDLKSKINSLQTTSGTNWEESFQAAQDQLDAIKADSSQDGEANYVIFLTDGQPSVDAEDQVGRDHSIANNAEGWNTAWTQSSDDARKLVTSGATFYGLFTWGESQYEHYIKSIVNYAYTGTGNYNTALSSDYEKYYTNADSTEALINALKQITHDITQSVGYTNVDLKDGLTTMTSSSLKVSGGRLSGLKYYRSGGSYGTANPEQGNYGTEWSDAPPATMANKTVDWNLGNLILENGVTYTVTFVVWPDQDSEDLVADLNNGKISYNSLTDDQKSQISINGTHYSLKTNTDYPTLTYSTVTTTTVDGQTTTVVSDPTTVTIKNPDPVALAEEKLNAVKKWDDSLDPSQRPKIKDVTLYLMKDGVQYYDEGLTLTPESNWTRTGYVAIAPGLMVTSDSPAYDATKPHVEWDGKTYAIIEPGHEYVFRESASDEHFELTAYTHHPMIMGKVNGKLNVVDVTFTKDSSGNITGIEAVEKMEDTISATNTLKPGINIEKKVVDSEGNEVNVTEPFDIIVNIKDESGNPLPTKQTTGGTEYKIDYRIYYGPNNPNYVDDGEGGGGRSDHIYVNDTTFTASIYVGDVIRVVNLELNAVFNVDETLPDKYESRTIEYSIGEPGSSDPSASGEYSDDDIVEIDGVDWYKVKGNTASYVVVTNKCRAPFYVYHSSDNTVEKIEMYDPRVVDGKFNIVNETKSGYIYGGYYKGYSKAGLSDAQIIAATYTKKSDSTTYTYVDPRSGGMWMTDSQGTAYTGDLTTWNKGDAQKGAYTADGTEMEPHENTVYYLKEVPEIYLTPAAYTVYDENDIVTDEPSGKDFHQILKLYMLSLTDDANYEGTGFDVVASTGLTGGQLGYDVAWGEKIDVIQSKKEGNYDTLFAKSVTGEDSREGLITAKDVTTNPDYIEQNAYFRHTPYHITPDNVKVTAVKRMLVYVRNTRFNEEWIRPGMTKTFTNTKSAYAVVPAPASE